MADGGDLEAVARPSSLQAARVVHPGHVDGVRLEPAAINAVVV